MAISVSKPTVGGSEDTWGTTINTGLDTIVDALNGTSGTVAPDLDTLTIGGTDVTATAAEINKLDGLTATTAELNYVDGVTSNIQTQIDTLEADILSDPTFTGTTTVSTISLGDWTVTQSGSELKFAYGGTNRMKLDSSGNLTVEGNITAYGSA